LRRAAAGRLAAAALFGAALAVACRVEEPTGAGVPAPEWTLEDLAGGSVSLADLRGRPVVIDFWATWCTPCEFQIPVLNQLEERYGDRVEVIGIAVDVDGREAVAPFAAARGITYRVLLGDEGLAQRYGAVGFPSLYVIRADGSIDSSHVGLVEPEALAEAVEAALRAGAGPPAG
jgi:cytochrome c biogenesis protein CcmG, thiol:disulfide interchange protein DsbE